MAALVCEICGGKLMAKAGGLFECEYCGMQYDKTRIQEMVQEIKGTVKVDGTVEVTGSVKVEDPVKVEGTATRESLLKRIQICAQDKEFNKVTDLAEQVLNVDPECGEAYLWLLLAEKKVDNVDQLFPAIPVNRKATKSLSEHKYWKSALRYSDADTATQLKQKIADVDAYWTRENPLVQKRYGQIQPVQKLLHDFYGGGLAALKSDGTILVTFSQDCAWLKPAAKWSHIQELVSNRFGLLLGLRWDGTVCAVSDDDTANNKILSAIEKWRNITALAIKDSSEYDLVVGLQADGTLVSAYLDPYLNEGEHVYAVTKKGADVYFALNATDWTDVKHINIVDLRKGDDYCYCVLGLTGDGHFRLSDVSAVPAMCDFWKSYDKIHQYSGAVKHCWGTTYLFEDGSVCNVCSGEKEKGGPFLDYWITINGVTDIGHYKQPYDVRDAVMQDTDVALLADGSIAVGFVSNPILNAAGSDHWKNLVLVKKFGIGEDALVGLDEDGNVLLEWYEDEEPGISVKGWKLFDSLESLEQERQSAKLRALEMLRKEAEEKSRQEQLRREEAARKEQLRKEEEARREQKRREEEAMRKQRLEAGLCQHCGGELKGLFSKKCVSCGKPKDY